MSATNEYGSTEAEISTIHHVDHLNAKALHHSLEKRLNDLQYDQLSTSSSLDSPSSLQSSLKASEDYARARDFSLQHIQTVPDSHNVDDCNHTSTQLTTGRSHASMEFIHSVFTISQKRFIVFMASWAGFFSPVSANIYLPALNALAHDLSVSNSLINLTLTSYMIFQGLAPAFIGNLADSMGRRPAYFVCFTLYLVANIALALQNSFPALFVLRCLQSSGSSGTIAMSSAVVADVSTPAERGQYMGFVLAGSLLGPAIGPVLGGILTQFLDWRAIFWFLTILAGVFLVIFAVFFPETARQIVGNGSIPPKGLNMSLMNYLAIRKAQKAAEYGVSEATTSTTTTAGEKSKTHIRFPNPLSSLKIILDKENALLLFYNAFMFAAFYDVTAIIPNEFERVYHFNDLQVGLCYIPLGVGSMAAALVNGQLLDRNFRRWCDRLGVQVKKGRDQDLRDFPIEKARIQLAIPAAYVVMALILVFGWVLDREGPLAVILVVLFFSSFALSIAFNVTSTLLVDFYPKQPATATAANNLVRCLLGAGATGVIAPMIDGMGVGWCFTFLSLFLAITSPMLWIVMWRGMDWRKQRNEREETAERKKLADLPAATEEGRMPSVEQLNSKDNLPSIRVTDSVGNAQDKNQSGR